MTKKQMKTLVILGLILVLAQVVGIPLSWKEWLSALIGIFCIGWGLHQRYGITKHTPHDAI
jgi:nicotinamide riboside transporter PnuC